MTDANPQAPPDELGAEWTDAGPEIEVVSITHECDGDGTIVLYDEAQPSVEAVIEADADWHFDLEGMR